MMRIEASYEPPAQFRTAIDQLHAIVGGELGHVDFGPADYLPGLKVLLQSMDYDPHFSVAGRRAAWGLVIAALRGRAELIRSMKDHEGFDAKAITSPVVITGVPRTGTGALHRLLAVDPRFQGLQTWLLDSPRPRDAATPQEQAAHRMAAADLHECCMLLRQSFVSNIWTSAWSSATYDAWWQCQSEEPAYHHYYRCVQLIGMNDPTKRWLLKNPGHIENLDLLFAVFPEAKVIQTHRDPAKALPSLVSHLMTLHLIMEEGRADRRAAIVLEREVAKWANALRKADEVRDRRPGQVLDIVHADFRADPMRAVERIYDFIGMDISNETRAGFAERINEKPELKRGERRHSIADYGMTDEQAREPFGDYVQRFDLREKTP